MPCALLPDSILLKKTQDAFSGATVGSIQFGRTISATLFDSLCSLWPGTSACISPSAFFDELLFKIAVRSHRLCILVADLFDAFVTACNLQRTNRGPGLNLRELIYGRINMMTALCPA